jgi:hypothetical protein
MTQQNPTRRENRLELRFHVFRFPFVLCPQFCAPARAIIVQVLHPSVPSSSPRLQQFETRQKDCHEIRLQLDLGSFTDEVLELFL